MRRRALVWLHSTTAGDKLQAPLAGKVSRRAGIRNFGGFTLILFPENKEDQGSRQGYDTQQSQREIHAAIFMTKYEEKSREICSADDIFAGSGDHWQNNGQTQEQNTHDQQTRKENNRHRQLADLTVLDYVHGFYLLVQGKLLLGEFEKIQKRLVGAFTGEAKTILPFCYGAATYEDGIGKCLLR